MTTRFAFALTLAVARLRGGVVYGEPPSVDCGEAEGTVEQLICADSALAALDVRLDDVWRQMLELSSRNPDLAQIKAEQRGWVKGRDECWNSSRLRECVEASYKSRIAELEARWRLVPARGPFYYFCNRNPANEVVATFFKTDPATAILERGDRSIVAFLSPSASGAKYEGRNVVFCFPTPG